jgi:hypothetical protein
VTPLTLSSPTKASLFWTILWRCCGTAEHGIARLGTAAAAVMSGTSRHSSEGNDALDGWESAIHPSRSLSFAFGTALLAPKPTLRQTSGKLAGSIGGAIGEIANFGWIATEEVVREGSEWLRR